MNLFRLNAALLCTLMAVSLVSAPEACALEQRNEVFMLRGPYNLAFFYRHNDSFRYSAAFHYHHGKQHDVLQLTPLSDHEAVDRDFDRDVTEFTYNKDAKTEPTMELFGPHTARLGWRVYRAIDWTHMHHEQTYDILSDKEIPWDKKKEWTDRAVRYFIEKNQDVARSIAPLDITMRRAGVMMKPYFTYYRNYYPRSNNYAYVAHWWHPVVYEAMMIGGNDEEQDAAVQQVNRVMLDTVFVDRPSRMLLSREIMPRYSRMSPESANIFDNLHMLHGIAFDILAYEGWTDEEKEKELYRFIDAMSYQPGDEKYARKFTTPHPDMDPKVYADWMKGYTGEMNRIMEEMMQEMMPVMMPEGMAPDMKEKMMTQFRKKLSPGLEEGEIPGSLMDAMKQVMPGMKMMPETMEAGKTPQKMVDAMLKGWEEKYGGMPDIEPWPMENEPTAPPLPSAKAVPASTTMTGRVAQ